MSSGGAASRATAQGVSAGSASDGQPGSSTGALAPDAFANSQQIVPMPSIIVTSLRHKFVNTSVGSLPTTSGTCDQLGFDEEHAVCDANSSEVSSDSGLDTDSEDGEDWPGRVNAKVHRRYIATSTLAGKKDAEEGEGSPGNRSTQIGTLDLPSVAELEGDGCDSASEADTTKCAPSNQSERNIDELEEDDMELGPPFLKLEEGVRPLNELPRCPPISWLTAAGFSVPSSSGFDSTPVAPVCGERPTRYHNLFCRKMIARQKTSDLTVGALARHDAKLGHSRHTDALPGAGPGDEAKGHMQNGAWLEAFLVRARAAPLCDVAVSICGDDMGHAVAGFLDGLSDTSDAKASIDAKDAPHGLHVTGRKVVLRPCLQGRGRTGFYVNSEAGISTPGRSQSPPPRHQPPPLPAEPPVPVLIYPPADERRDHRRP